MKKSIIFIISSLLLLSVSSMGKDSEIGNIYKSQAEMMTGLIKSGTENQPILKIKIDSKTMATVSDFHLKTNLSGLKNETAISQVKLFYTGNSDAFSPEALYGQAPVTNQETLVVSGDQQITQGTHYFWLAIDVNSQTPPVTLQASCESMTVADQKIIPAPVSTSEALKIENQPVQKNKRTMEDQTRVSSVPSQNQSSVTTGATYVTNSDNTGNGGTGPADFDMDTYLFNDNEKSPIEFFINVTGDLPQNSAILAIYVYDVDEEAGEVNHVYFNGHFCGKTHGEDSQYNITSFVIPIEWVRQGNNLVRYEIDVYEGDWASTVDWGQLVIDGGNKESGQLTDLYIADSEIDDPYCHVYPVFYTEVTTTGYHRYIVNLVDPMGNMLDSHTYNLHLNAGVSSVGITVDIPINSVSGPYTIQVIMIAPDLMTIEDYREVIYAYLMFYVDQDADGENNGSSWENAFNDLQDALQHPGINENYQVWVAEGTYLPSHYFNGGGNNANLGKRSKTLANPRLVSFEIPSGVEVYGGFEGIEVALSERDDIEGHPTILSGDIGVPSENWDNSFHVVVFDHAGDGTTLDGFIIQDGLADGGAIDETGGGILCNLSVPTITNCKILNNSTSGAGAGMAIHNSTPLMTNLEISSNFSDNIGGGLYISGPQSAPYIDRCIISGNSSVSKGGGIFIGYNEYSVTIRNSILTGNSAFSELGAGGAMALSGPCSAIMENVTITGNHSTQYGGGIYTNFANFSILNSIVQFNSSGEGRQVYTWSSGLQIVDCNIASDDYDLMGTGESFFDRNINQDPLFIEPLDPNNAPSTAGDFHLSGNSPSVNAGNNDGAALPYDLDGNERIRYGTVDHGAYELTYSIELLTRQIPDYDVEVGERFVHTTIPLTNFFYVIPDTGQNQQEEVAMLSKSASATDEEFIIEKSIYSIEDSITAKYCCCCCGDTLIWGAIHEDILYLRYTKHADGFGTVTLQGNCMNDTAYISFDVTIKSVIPGDTTNYFGDTSAVAVEEELMPTEFSLSQNYPNPFNPTTVIPFALPESSPVVLTIYDISGKLVKSLVFGTVNAGYHRIEIDAEKFSTGIYFYRIQAGNFSDIKKMTIIK
ncbi:MAG: T9SS type A sorting domain-containing protein [Candidatus Marinimicrobia bacterium]|nr:T9SS type A sorting domain-containing protein [Candidatus Neomarinimicrobiota bacterium]